MIQPFKFDAEKAVEAILYVASRVKSPTLHTISKLLYFADVAHLEHYGRFITGDSYVAMKHGPVPSGTYDVMKYVRGDGVMSFAEHARAAFDVVGGHNIKPFREPDLGLFSRSDLACLDEAIAKYGARSFRELTSLSHDAAWHSADADDAISLEAILKTLPNKKRLADYLAGHHL